MKTETLKINFDFNGALGMTLFAIQRAHYKKQIKNIIDIFEENINNTDERVKKLIKDLRKDDMSVYKRWTTGEFKDW